MLRVLIMDDERLILDELRASLDWGALGFEIVGTAQNGADGLRLMRTLSIDVVITDVKMPLMDGLEFARRAREIDRFHKLIFVSGYDEFDLVKQAMSVRADSYILKPVDVGELEETLRSVKHKWQQDFAYYHVNAAALETSLGALMTEENGSRAAMILHNLEQLPEIPRDSVFIPVYFSLDRYRTLANHEAVEAAVHENLSVAARRLDERATVCGLGGGGFICLFFGTPPDAERLAQINRFEQDARNHARECLDATLSVAMGNEPCPLHALPDLRRALEKAVSARFFDGFDRPFMLGRPERKSKPVSFDGSRDVEAIRDALRRDDPQGARRAFEDALSRMDAEMLCEASAKRHTTRLLTEALAGHRTNPEYGGFSDADALAEKIERADTWAEVKSIGEAAIEAARDGHADTLGHARIVEKALELLNCETSPVYTVNDLARQLFISPNYLRTLFKRVTGETLYAAQTRIKLARAETLLSQTDMRVQDIAAALGFDYAAHFITLFARHKKITPAQYRKSIVLSKTRS